ncbi:hypothetical protein [Brassicibacter mesophilus]|uniref:hypothetical protein n=1 Tax=Brassicibacter mesophilus TaxID=745119 RepID=UPI003D24E3A2
MFKISDNKQFTIFSIMSKPKQVVDEKIPDNIKLKPSEWWCPYCSMPVIFKKNKSRGIKICPVCGISEKDYWVKKVNY